MSDRSDNAHHLLETIDAFEPDEQALIRKHAVPLVEHDEGRLDLGEDEVAAHLAVLDSVALAAMQRARASVQPFVDALFMNISLGGPIGNPEGDDGPKQ